MTDDDLDRIRAIVRHRCPELSDDDIAEAYGPAEPDPGVNVWLEVAELVIDVVGAFEERLEVLERTIGGEDENDDATGDRRRA